VSMVKASSYFSPFWGSLKPINILVRTSLAICLPQEFLRQLFHYPRRTRSLGKYGLPDTRKPYYLLISKKHLPSHWKLYYADIKGLIRLRLMMRKDFASLHSFFSIHFGAIVCICLTHQLIHAYLCLLLFQK